MKNLAELKRRIKVGTRILKTKGYVGKGVNEIRIVTNAQTNSFAMNGSWLDYPKATLIEFDKEDENKFRIYYPKQITETGFAEFDYKQKGELVGEYVILEDIVEHVNLYTDELLEILATNKVYCSYEHIKVNQIIYLQTYDNYLRIDGISYGNPNLYSCSLIYKEKEVA